MNALVKLEPIQLPNPRRPTQMPSLPAWLEARRAALATNLQQVDGRFQDVPTLPASLMLNDQQRTEIQAHIGSLNCFLSQTPANDVENEKAIFASVSKLLLVKPAKKTSEAAAEARQDAFVDSLDDVAFWAVDAAIRKWYRGECGKDENGKLYDYTWAPEPHQLRKLALFEMFMLRRRIGELEPLLQAVEFVDSTAELERGRKAMDEIFRRIGNGGDLKNLSFDEAVSASVAHETAPKTEAA